MPDTFQSRKNLPLVPNSRVVQQMQNGDFLGTETGELISVNVNEMDSVGAGLQNEIGEYNCFLNVIIQVCKIAHLTFIFTSAACS